MSTQTVHFPSAAPIPLGHEVEVRVYAVEEGLFVKEWTPRPFDPLVIDRTTGVTYGSAWHFMIVSMYRAGEMMPQIPMTVRSDLQLHATVVGKVRSCRVMWIGGGDSRFPQTTLVLDTSGASGRIS